MKDRYNRTLSEIRKDREKTLEFVAHRMGINIATLSRTERGMNGRLNYYFNLIQGLKREYGVDDNYLKLFFKNDWAQDEREETARRRESSKKKGSGNNGRGDIPSSI